MKLDTREQWFVAAGAPIALIGLYFGGLRPGLERRAEAAEARVQARAGARVAAPPRVRPLEEELESLDRRAAELNERSQSFASRWARPEERPGCIAELAARAAKAGAHAELSAPAVADEISLAPAVERLARDVLELSCPAPALWRVEMCGTWPELAEAVRGLGEPECFALCVGLSLRRNAGSEICAEVWLWI